jgi:hypothetical protein
MDLGRNDLGPEILWAELVWGRIDLIPIYFGNIEINLNSDLNDKDDMRNIEINLRRLATVKDCITKLHAVKE